MKIKVCTKQELGLAYRPDLTPDAARHSLMEMLWETASRKQRTAELEALGLTRSSRKMLLTKEQVALIFELLTPP